MTALQNLSRSQSVRRVLWIVLALNLAVMLIKLGVGMASDSLSVIADAFQSVVDAASNVIGLLGMWVSARPADENHPYGHYKYETIAALGLGAMLLAAGYEIGKGVIARFLGTAPGLEITPLTFGLMGFTFLVNLGIVAYETRAGRQLQSQVLLADAAQTRTNLWVTVSVIGSLLGARLGWVWLDPTVAVVILGLLFRVAFDILRSTSEVLTDVAVANPNEVKRIALGVPGVRFVSGVRSR
ncbi:MAG: cation transporter, partial [Chloroflexi bacterium]|nr:cation transporter [Chloroflexota bacterium]